MSCVKLFLTFLFQILLVLSPIFLIRFFEHKNDNGGMFIINMITFSIVFILTWLIIVFWLIYSKIKK